MNSTILTVMRKELARFFGDYRMVMTTILLPGILIFVLYQFMGDAMLSQFTTDKFAPKCTAVNIPDDWSAELKKNGFRIHKGNADTMDSARQKVKDQKAELCIVFPEDFAKQVEEYEVSSGKPAPNIAIYYNSASTDSANAYDTLCTYLDQKESAMANKFDVNHAYYIINIWKETGWQTVIFMATLAGINTELYEAAAMDGAGRWGKMRYITFPALQNTILTVLILNLAKVMNLFESAFVMQNDAVLGTANVLETYIYYQTFNSGAIPNYGYTTAVGLFKSLVGCVLVLFCNHLSKKVRDGRGIV